VTVHVPVGCRLVAQPDSTAKSAAFAPPSETFEIASAAVPVFVTVTVAGGLVVLTVCEPNLTGFGARETAGSGGAEPAPLNVTAWGLPFALSEMRN